MRGLALLALSFILGACAPMMIQDASRPGEGFAGPQIMGDRFVSFDGAALGLTRWEPQETPSAVIVGVHGMNDYANAFHLAAPWWSQQGVATWAYDQRGFGRSPLRGVWAGEDLMVEDLRTLVALARARYPHAVIAVAGESMGGAVAIRAFASDRPPPADRLILLSPAVWGWRSQPLPNRTLLWLAANLTASKVYTPPRWLTDHITPTDNIEEMYAMGADPMMVWGARSDTLYGLVTLMDEAADDIERIRPPALYLYGEHDQIIPKRAAFRAVRRLGPGARTAYYDKGYHLMTRDMQGPTVWRDILSFVRDPAAALPSGAPAIPARHED